MRSTIVQVSESQGAPECFRLGEGFILQGCMNMRIRTSGVYAP